MNSTVKYFIVSFMHIAIKSILWPGHSKIVSAVCSCSALNPLPLPSTSSRFNFFGDKKSEISGRYVVEMTRWLKNGLEAKKL